MSQIQEKAKQLLDLRNEINKISETVKVLKGKKELLQQDIMSDLDKQGFMSIKTENATISKAVKKTLQIINEKELMIDLKKRGLNDYVREMVDKDLWKGLSTELVRKDEKMNGTEIQTTEYISIRKSS